jgi:tetratricopeptide (TPR) repeat protein
VKKIGEMGKISSICSGIKKIFSIISGIWKRKTDAGNSEDIEQLFDREENTDGKKEIGISNSEEIEQLSERVKELKAQADEREKEIKKCEAAILRYEITEELKEEHRTQLTEFKGSIMDELNEFKGNIMDDLKKEKEKGIAFNFITSEGELRRFEDVVKTVKSIPDEKLKRIVTVSDFTKQAPVKDIEKILTKEEAKEKLRAIQESVGLTDDDIIRLKLIMGLYKELPKGEVPDMDGHQLLFDILKYLHYCVENFTNLLYNDGVMLYNKRDFRRACMRFDIITKVAPNCKEAWLNKGAALGKLGYIDREIDSYKKANKDGKCKKAAHNEKIAKRIKRIKNALRWFGRIKNVRR